MAEEGPLISENGIASVIDMLTSVVVDYEILSNYCAKCKISEANESATMNGKRNMHQIVCKIMRVLPVQWRLSVPKGVGADLLIK